MTRPAPWRRSTAAERRANRAAFAKLKAACETGPSMQAYRARNRRSDYRTKARTKLRAMLAGKGVRPFSELQLAALRADEFEQLRVASGQRFLALSETEREALRRNLSLVLMTLPDDLYNALARYTGVS
jgi:hypothetical protein